MTYLYIYIYVYILIIQEILLKFSLWGFAIFSEGNMVAKKKKSFSYVPLHVDHACKMF